ncbi:hypothetical protein D3M55_22050 [Klebsiella pneumoniae]|nr:hypothetical protein [Klebsiella pneumoniae]
MRYTRGLAARGDPWCTAFATSSLPVPVSPLISTFKSEAATNRDLRQEVVEGRFRADLYHRLSVFPLSVPPLRERESDVVLLAGYFCEQCRLRMGLARVILAEAARNRLQKWSWPGNVRELEHAIHRAVVLARATQAGDSGYRGEIHLHGDPGAGDDLVPVVYPYTVIPALVMTWCLSYIERWVDRITPAVTKNFLKPMLIVLIAAPLAILLIGPLGIWIGSAISALVYTIHSYLGWLSVAIMGGLWPLLVMTGMHRVFTPTIIQTIAETGKEGMVMPSEIGANLSLGGSSLAVAWKTKNPELRQTALAAAASAILAGISEPALYGVAVRLKRPLIASLISGFICGAVAGIAGLASHSMAAPGLFTSVQFFDPANPMTIVWVFGVMALSVVLSFALTLILGFEDIPVEQAAADARARQARAQASHA